MADRKINGGFYIKAKRIQESEIAHAAPVVRELWDLLIRTANYDSGIRLNRGQVLLRISDIQDSLHWMKGYVKMTYSPDQCEAALKWLLVKGMITVAKTARGSVVTICKYDYYQNPDNYERGMVKVTKPESKPPRTPSLNQKEEKKEEKKKEIQSVGGAFTSDQFVQAWMEWEDSRIEQKKPITPKAMQAQIKNLNKFSEDVAIKAIQKSIENGWQGLFPEKYVDVKSAPQKPMTPSQFI
jgi:hypothetical protein